MSNEQPSSKLPRTVLITGASGGIGRATARALARTGEYNLALHYNSASEDRLKHIHESITAVSPSTSLAFYQADLSSYDDVRRLHSEVVNKYGSIDVLFNNAGMTGGISGPASLADVDMETFEKTWRVNTASAFLLTQLCLPEMERRQCGRVVFCSSVAALTGGFVGPHYASSKSALHGFVHWLGQNVAKKGITVNAVAPALITDTSMLPPPDKGDFGNSLAQKVPVGRLGRPEEIAETVLWLVKTPFVTRKIITVDGGMHPC